MADRPKILLTNPTLSDGMALLEPHTQVIVAPDTEPATLKTLAADVEGIIVRAQLPDDILDHAPKVRGIVRHGVGLDFIPVKAATRRGIPVANLPGCNAQAVAEYCIAALLHMSRPIAKVEAELRADGWHASRGQANDFLELGGRTLGIVGVGTIGGRLAGIAHHGFGMRVLGASRRSGRMPDFVEDVLVDKLFARADAIALCCALTEETRGLVNAERIAAMKPDAVLINVSRGPVVDTPALIHALQTGAIAGAALDVHDASPLAPDDPVLTCPRLFPTPHIAGITATSLRNMSVGAAEEMLRILRGEDPVNLVNPDYRQSGEKP